VSPDDFAEAPELACIDILGHAAQVARVALFAANPELRMGDFICSVLDSRSLQACAADAVVTHLDALETALGRYRDFALNAPRTPTSNEI
jgi:hypothetical protein